jgi:hypothetical protein
MSFHFVDVNMHILKRLSEIRVDLTRKKGVFTVRNRQARVCAGTSLIDREKVQFACLPALPRYNRFGNIVVESRFAIDEPLVS